MIRVRAAGICHSDVHYRAGVSSVNPLPLTLGHEVAGTIEEVGQRVTGWARGDRACVHYLATCGQCPACLSGNEQFCAVGQMIGKHRDGGFAEFLTVPARSVFHLPAEIPFEAGAVMMCSSATSLHALRKARLKPGESVAVFGLGGLGMSAVQLAKALGAGAVYGVDIKEAKLTMAHQWGAIPINAAKVDAVAEIRRFTANRGVDVALELIGLPSTMRQAVLSLAALGRAGLVGITDRAIEFYPYQEILNKEAEIIGVSDHLASELPALIEFARIGKLDLSSAISRVIDRDETAINNALDNLGRFGDEVRTVIRS
jgi:propanol-preferring alcohol dehydrogenase